MGEAQARELEVALLARDLTNEQIGSQVHLSVHIVKFHLSNAYGKLGIQSRNELPAALAAYGVSAATVG